MWLFPLIWIFWDHCRVIKWTNFNMVVPQGKESLKRGGERGKQLVSRALRTNTLIDQICCLIWAGFMVCENSYSTNIEDWFLQITVTSIIVIKIMKCHTITKMGHRHKMSRCSWENGADSLAWCVFAQTFNLLTAPHNTYEVQPVKHNKTRYTCVLLTWFPSQFLFL